MLKVLYKSWPPTCCCFTPSQAISGMLVRTVTALLSAAASAVALPNLHSRAPVTPLTDAQIASFKPYALFARAAYCPASSTNTWSCGVACNELPGFIPYAAGGDGDLTPYWYVGYYPPLESIIISNQGLDPSSLLHLLEDADIVTIPLNPLLFPGVGISVRALSEFQLAQAGSASEKLSAVQKAMSEQQVTQITLTGHNMGGAISLLDALFLELHLSASVKLKVVTHGMPRVGNQNFAELVDSYIADLSHINNMRDTIPITPGRFLEFSHPSGEIHIVSSELEHWVVCQGQENADDLCTIGTVPNIFEGEPNDNKGPYNGVVLGACP
ncbi:hypothetical protein FRC08_001317 [Ceratobasidium sp. 394]|nr:hypothetical protein FRC08_001317 [Ceratobasidium sp. 394]